MGKIDPRPPRPAAPASAAPPAISVRFWGVRGSIPVPGPSTIAYGGNTPCLEVRVNGRLFIVDAGSGITGLGQALNAGPERDFDILLSHLHHDHIIGLPFFKPLHDPSCGVRIHAGNLGGASPEDALRRMFSAPLFPIELDYKTANIGFRGFTAGETLSFADGSRVRTHPLRHPGGATGYRFDAGGRAVACVYDFEHAGATPEPAMVEFVRGCDAVIYDTMFTTQDYPPCQGWGHSTIAAGLALCRAAGAKRLVAFHHNPDYDDAKLAELEAALKGASPDSFTAREGMSLAYEALGARAGLRGAG
jgi:phosphoribosyl 1,2-cyclic phosphodiesterase